MATILRDRGIYQRWLARKIGIHESVLSRYLAGHQPMPPEITAAIAAVLNVPAAAITTPDEELSAASA